MRKVGRLTCLLAVSLLVGGWLAASPAQAFEDPKACCRIIRVDLEKSTAWLRNPKTAVVAQFRLGADDRELFKVGDLFNPETNELNGKKLERKYAMSLPQLGPSNAHILRVRGHEFAAEGNENKKVYRSRTLKFDNTLSSMRPGDEVYVDEEAGWIFISVEGYGKVKPSVWAYKLE